MKPPETKTIILRCPVCGKKHAEHPEFGPYCNLNCLQIAARHIGPTTPPINGSMSFWKQLFGGGSKNTSPDPRPKAAAAPPPSINPPSPAPPTDSKAPSGEKNENNSPPTLRCTGCGRIYRIGDDAVAVAPEFALARLGPGIVFSDGGTPDREDLVSTVDAPDARETARPSWEIIEKNLASGQRRKWCCGACNRVNDYSFQRPAARASEPQRTETVESRTAAPAKAERKKRLIEVNREVSGGFTALHIAANKGQVALMHQLIAEGANVRVKHPSDRETPMHGAAANGHKDAVELLIAKGGKVNARNKWGSTPLHMTTDKEVAEVLVANGADVNAKDDGRITPLGHALSLNKIPEEMIRFLVFHGADLNGYASGLTLLQAAIVRFAPLDIVELMIAKGADVNARNPAIFGALNRGALNRLRSLPEAIFRFALRDIVKLLTIAKEDADDIDYKWVGWTALHMSCETSDDPEEIELLISKGANVNAKNKDGNTPLHIAACNRHGEVVKLLIAKGANVNAQNSSRDTPLDLAMRELDGSIVKLLIANGASSVSQAALEWAACIGNAEDVQALIAKGADVNAKNDQGQTTLIAAARNGRGLACVQALITGGADVNARDNNGHTALMSAAAQDEPACFNALIAAGADVNARDNNGYTALMAAAENGRADIVKALIAAGADVRATYKYENVKKTALTWAKDHDYRDVVAVLKAAGATD